MNLTDKICDLNCIKQGDNVHDFPGPVKIILVDPPEDQYNRRKSGAAFIAMATMMIGANTFWMLLFVLGFKLPKFINFHIILCTVGLQFCMPLAILMMHSLHGASAPLKKSQRRIEHLLLQLIGLGCSVSGGVMAIFMGEESFIDPPDPYTSIHFFSGVTALGLAGICLLLGPILLFLREGSCLGWVHRFFGILTLVASSVCFICGIIKPTMQVWLYVVGYMAPTYIIVFFTTFYTLSVIIYPMTNLFCSSSNKKM